MDLQNTESRADLQAASRYGCWISPDTAKVGSTLGGGVVLVMVATQCLTVMFNNQPTYLTPSDASSRHTL